MSTSIKRAGMAYTVAKVAISVLLTAACTRAEAIEKIPAGTEVTVMTQDGQLVRGKIAEVQSDKVMLTGESPNTTTEIARSSIKEVKRVDVAETTAATRDAAAPAPAEATPAAPIVRTITVPDNTVLDVTLSTPLSSKTSRVEEPVRATVASPVIVDGITVIPAGSALTGHVTSVRGSGKVKGRAQLAFRFTRLTANSTTYDVATKPFSYLAPATKKADATKIGIGAGAGAVIGAIAGGKKGAAIGTAVGGGAGTGVVLATEGKQVSLATGRKLKVSLTNPLTIRTK